MQRSPTLLTRVRSNDEVKDQYGASKQPLARDPDARFSDFAFNSGLFEGFSQLVDGQVHPRGEGRGGEPGCE